MSKSTEQGSTATDLAAPRTGGRARVLFGVAVGFVAVAGTAALLFMLVGNSRYTALKRQYARQMAHIAGQVEASVSYCEERVQAAVGASERLKSCRGGFVTGHQAADEPVYSIQRDTSHSAAFELTLSDLLLGVRQNAERRRNGRADALQQVLLVNAQGRVLDQLQTRSTLRLNEFPPLLKGGTAGPYVVDHFVVGPDTYVAFVQPLPLLLAPIDASGAVGSNTRLSLVGLAGKEPLETARFEVSPVYFLWAVLLLSMGVLALPLTKLWLIGHKAPFGRVDLALLFASAILTALLATTLFLGFLARNRLQVALDDQLRTVARQLGRDFDQRVSDSARVLAQVDNTAKLGQLGVVCSQVQENENLFCQGDVPGAPKDWRRLFITDAQGMQISKLVRERDITPFVNLSKRSYFVRARDNRLESVHFANAQKQSETVAISADIVKSVTTSALVLIVAKPQRTGSTLNHVVGIESDLGAFSKRVLPAGFQALIVHPYSGDILLHIGREAYYAEDIYSSVDDSDSVRAQVSARVRAPLDFEYLNAPMRAQIQPLASGLSLLVLAPSSIVDKLIRQIVVLSLVGFAVLSFFVAWALMFWQVVLTIHKPAPDALVLSSGRVATPADLKPPARLFQPDATKRLHYARIGLAALALGIVQGLCALLLPSVSLAIWLPLSAACALALMRVLSSVGERPQRPPPRGRLGICENLQLAYSTCCFGFLVLLICAPVAALFGASYEALAELSTRAEHNHIGRSLRPPDQSVGKLRSQLAVGGIALDANDSSWRAGHAQSDFRGCLWQPMSCLMDLLRPFDHAAVQGSGRLYQVDRDTEINGQLAMRQFARHSDELSSQQTPGFKLTSRVPTLASLHYNRLRLVGLCTIFALFLMANVVVLYRSMERLLTLRLLSSHERPKVVSADDLTAELGARLSTLPSRHKVARILLLATPELAERVCRCRNAQPIPTFHEFDGRLNDPDILWCVTDLMSLDESQILQLERAYTQARGAVLVFTPNDWTRVGDVERRARWAKLFRDQPAIRPYERHHSPTGPSQLVTMWSECDQDERRVLGQLSRRGYATPHPGNTRTLEHLVARHILDPDTLTFRTKELLDFVRTQTSSADLAELERGNEPSPWRAIRVPLTTSVAILLMSIGVSQPELAAAGLSIPGLFALLPAVISRVTNR